MRIGYACLTLGVANASFRTCSLKNATSQNLTEIVRSNLLALDSIFDYNRQRNIHLFRISSDLIPFGSHPDVDFVWDSIFCDELANLGEKARRARIRLSMHPGQYTVLNSPDQGVVKRAVQDLHYHSRVLDALQTDRTSKIILHVGGAYGDKKSALARFADNYRNLDDRIRERLVIENDDKIFTIEEVLELGNNLGVPVVFDNLHHEINPSNTLQSEAAWISDCVKTWRPEDGTPKTHYSQQAPHKRAGSHSATIHARTFLEYHSKLTNDVDIMLEVKDKNLSAVKCILCLASPGKISDLEKEWAQYKYLVLEHSQKIYNGIRALLKDKNAYPAAELYELIDTALSTDPEPGTRINAAQHVWGYFSKNATSQEKARFETLMDKYTQGMGSINAVKRHLFRLAHRYNEKYLLQSYYFVI